MRKFKGIRALLWIMGVRFKKAPALISDTNIATSVIACMQGNPSSWVESIPWDERSGRLSSELLSVTKNDDRIVVSVTIPLEESAYVVLGSASSYYVDLEVKQLLRKRYLHNRTRFDYLFKQLTKTGNSGDCLS
jgi:hypothetical protein